MNRSSQNPDAYDKIRDDALVELHAAALAKCDRQAARIRELESELKAMTSAADMLEAQKDAIGRERGEARRELAARGQRITELEAQLAECRKIRTDYRMGVDPVEYNDLYYRAEGEIDSLRTQLAAATERERAARKLAGRWASNYLELLIGQIEQPENEWMFEMLRPELTQLAAALAAAQPKEAK